MTVRISEKDTGYSLGEISDEDFALLTGHMEEESSTDNDYFVETLAIDNLEEQGASPEFIALLRKAVGTSEGLDLVWTRS